MKDKGMSESMLGKALSRLGLLVNRLYTSVEDLEARLEPVMRSAELEEKEPKGVKKSTVARVDSVELDNLILEKIIKHLDSIRERLEC